MTSTAMNGWVVVKRGTGLNEGDPWKHAILRTRESARLRARILSERGFPMTVKRVMIHIFEDPSRPSYKGGA